MALDGQQRGEAVLVGAGRGDGFALEPAKGGGAEVGIGEGKEAGGGGVGAAGVDKRALSKAVAVGDNVHAGGQACQEFL